MKAEWKNRHTVVITYEPGNWDKLMSPDRLLHLLPCEKCCRLDWVQENVVSFVCQNCTTKRWREEHPDED